MLTISPDAKASTAPPGYVPVIRETGELTVLPAGIIVGVLGQYVTRETARLSTLTLGERFRYLGRCYEKLA